MSDAPTDKERLQQRNRELSILHEVAAALNGTVELREALDTALREAGELLELETGWIWLLEPDTGEPYLAAARNLPPGLASRPETMEGGCYCLDTFRAGDHEGAANINVLTCSRLRQLSEGTEGLRYHASVPLQSGEQRLGVLNLASRDWRKLGDDELSMLRTMSDMLSIAIVRTRLFSRSTQLGAAEERNRLARDIHDTLAQSLTGIVMQLETAEALSDGGAQAGEVESKIGRALELSRRALTEARRSVHDLRAAPLEDKTLVEALEALCRTHRISQVADVRFDAVGGARPLLTRIEAGLFRICQEALNNVAAHAQAGVVEVRLELAPERVALSVRDDGVGFEADAGDDDSFGLVGMSERARLLGGELRLETARGDGTRLVVSVPVVEVS
jgi:two-component system, NarL family, sensor kinase